MVIPCDTAYFTIASLRDQSIGAPLFLAARSQLKRTRTDSTPAVASLSHCALQIGVGWTSMLPELFTPKNPYGTLRAAAWAEPADSTSTATRARAVRMRRLLLTIASIGLDATFVAGSGTPVLRCSNRNEAPLVHLARGGAGLPPHRVGGRVRVRLVACRPDRARREGGWRRHRRYEDSRRTRKVAPSADRARGAAAARHLPRRALRAHGPAGQAEDRRPRDGRRGARQE